MWCYSLAQEGNLHYSSSETVPQFEELFCKSGRPKIRPKIDSLKKKYFSLPMTEINLLFYQSVMPLFTDLNKLLQNEEPKLHVLRKEMYMFLKKILGTSIQVPIYGDKDLATIDEDDKDNLLPPTKWWLDLERVQPCVKMTSFLQRKFTDIPDRSIQVCCCSPSLQWCISSDCWIFGHKNMYQCQLWQCPFLVD